MLARMPTDQLGDVGDVRPTFMLTSAGWHHSERLAHVLLMDANGPIAGSVPVVALDDDGGLVPEPHDARGDGPRTSNRVAVPPGPRVATRRASLP